MLDSLRRDLRDAFRALRAAPVMSATIVCLVALVVGGNTTVYGLVHAVLTEAGARCRRTATGHRSALRSGEPTPTLHQYSDFEVFSDLARTLHSIAAVRLEPLTLRVGPLTDAVRGGIGYRQLLRALRHQILAWSRVHGTRGSVRQHRTRRHQRTTMADPFR